MLRAQSPPAVDGVGRGAGVPAVARGGSRSPTVEEEGIWPAWRCSRGWLARLLRLLRETANPDTMHIEDLSPAERLKQASFESFDYHKPYPAMYLAYLRTKKRAARAGSTPPAGATSVVVVPAADADDGSDAADATEQFGLHEPLQPSPAVSLGTSSVPGLPVGLPVDEEDRHTLLRWLLHVLIAISVGVVATLVSYAVEIMETYRAETLTRVIGAAPFRLFGYVMGFVVWLAMCVGLAAVAAGVVVYFEPAAAGGGIPDVMAYLNGVHMRNAMNIKTFIAKAISCICGVASGLPVGLEAPLIHLGAITGAGVTQGRSRTLGFQTSFFSAFRNNKDRRDFITAGAACGVSAAFGAPIGGLLFVMEEVSSFWDHSSSGQIFLATMVAFTVTTIINSLVEDNSLLGWVSNSASVLFEVNLTIPLNLVSIVPSFFLGAILGGLAALFTKANLVMIKWRRRVLRPYPLRRFLEPVVVAAVYGTLMYSLTLLSDCRPVKAIRDINETIHVWGTEGAGRLFNDTCPTPGEYSPLGTLNMATGKNTIRHLFTRQTVGEFPVYYLAIHFVIYFVFACIASGMALSAGLVVPSLVIGAIFGRLYGLLLWSAGAHHGMGGVARSYPFTDAWMDPGVFALIGAGAFLAGTSRMAMSVCVIMVELSSELHYLLPVMVAIVMSKTVADWLSEPLYHQMMHLDSVPYLGAALLRPEFEQLTAADVMASPVVVLRRRERTEVILHVLQHTTHHAFPVVAEVAGEGSGEDGAGVGSAAVERFAAPGSAHVSRWGGGAPQGAAAAREDRGGVVHSPTHIRGLDEPAKAHSGAHMKCVGLVTREDLRVYLTLPALRRYATSAEARAREADGLASCVQEVNRMTWPEWVRYKSSLFLTTPDRYEWVRGHVSVASAAESGPQREPAGTPRRSSPAAAKAATAEAAERAASPTTCSAETDAVPNESRVRDVPVLPPVLDLTLIINRSPWVITPAFNLQMAYDTFRTMGLRHMLVVDGDVVMGMITRKDLLVDALRSRMKALRARLGEGQAAAHRPASPPTDLLETFFGRATEEGAVTPTMTTRQPTWSPPSPPPPPDSVNHVRRVQGPGVARSVGHTRASQPQQPQQGVSPPPPPPRDTPSGALLWEG